MQSLSFFRLTILSFLSLFTVVALAQTGRIEGLVTDGSEAIAFASVRVVDTEWGTSTDASGAFSLRKMPLGEYTVTVSFIGYKDVSQQVTLSEATPKVELDFELTEDSYLFDAVVVTGTKTFLRQTDSPVMVNVLGSETLNQVQACNLSDGLKFQPGLRVETDCQTCNYTQLRMNGLAGGYSQILINGRPIFSPLTGLYGLEQLPVNMIDRIEVVRGGGSSLYGSSAIGGTVNILTKIPKTNSYEISYLYQNINGGSNDQMLTGNSSLVADNGKAGVSFFLNKRDREWYDHNDDNFSEIPLIENTSIGTHLFFLPSEQQKIELSFSNLNEYRYGGEMVEEVAHLTQQSEERTHKVNMGSLDYQLNSKDENSSLIAYVAWQNTKRDHYTGIIPDDGPSLQTHLEAPPYGNSLTTTFQGGLQLNHRLRNFPGNSNVLTFGGEYLVDDVYDEIPAYRYLIDQTTKDLGVFLQSNWEIADQLTLLSGLRADKHNLIDKAVLSPRLSLLYKQGENTQFRVNYGTGFRAPQAFDTDLHIAFAGGGISRVQLSPELAPERSRSWSSSINYDKPTEHFVAGFTLEGFYTRLDRAFFLQPLGEDDFGEIFEKQNGQGAEVRGLTVELRAYIDRKIQLEGGFTVQSSTFDEEVSYIDELPGIREFIRTPNTYGFALLTLTPSDRWNASFNYVYTGSMKVPHFAGAPNQTVDEIIDSPTFSELSVKAAYLINLPSTGSKLELFSGVKNLFNAYQDDFDIGKNRDSNFVYGPAQPRTLYIGVKLKGKV